MISGYPNTPSLLPGETLTLHVSTDQPRFLVEFYRQGAIFEFKGTSEWMIGQHSESGPGDRDWDWRGYDFSIPDDWPSGVYIAVLYEGDEENNIISFPDATTADGRSSKALFVLRSLAPGEFASILYKVPLFTYQAYNGPSQIDSLYLQEGGKVTLRRPGGGTGGSPWDMNHFPDFYDGSSPRETFQHWDALFIGWMEANGYVADYCTDLDIHENPDNFLAAYNLLLSVGHDEYWSAEMRENVEGFIQEGGNVAFHTANAVWWRVHVEDGNTALSCDKRSNFDRWHRFDPENRLTGVSYRNGGGQWEGEREAVGYRVQHSDHWVYEGTGLGDGDNFGVAEHLVGYECDGALFEKNDLGVKGPTGADGTPLNFIILGTGEMTPGWWADFIGGNFTATMGIYTRNGTVFTAATTDWARVLTIDNNPAVDRITRNVLDRLQTRGV